MPFRISDAPTSSTVAAQVSAARRRFTTAQEQISTGKKINRPSDDPRGAAAVIDLRTSQSEINQMKRNAGAASDVLLASDGALDHYENLIDRARTLLMQGASGTTTPVSRGALAAEVDNLRIQMLAIANSQREGIYLFGGTRQDEPPYNSATGVPSATLSAERKLRVEPNMAPITVGFRAEDVFADANGAVFDTLTGVAAALRGTGNPTADETTVLQGIDRLDAYGELAKIARARVGPNINVAEAALERLGDSFLSSEETAQRIESVDIAEAAVRLSESQNALQAIIAARGTTGRRSLIDYLG